MFNAKLKTPTNKAEYLELLQGCLSEIDKLSIIIDANSQLCEMANQQAA